MPAKLRRRELNAGLPGGNTNHYTTADLLGRLGLESLHSSASLDTEKNGAGDLEQLFVSKPNGSIMVEKTSKSSRPRFCNVPG